MSEPFIWHCLRESKQASPTDRCQVLGNDGLDVASIVNFPVGARAEILNVTAN